VIFNHHNKPGDAPGFFSGIDISNSTDMKRLFIPLILALLACCKPTEKTTSVARLENTYWKLSEMNGMPVITPADAKEVHMVLSSADGEKQLRGFGGCNGLGGSYTVDGNKIKFTTISTRMFCEGRMEVENFLTTVLREADTYKITGETLELYEGNTFLAKFESVYLH
jgi:heat shock protein HslJ